MAQLPGWYSYGFVAGQITQWLSDTNEDADRLPEMDGAKGSITFTPSADEASQDGLTVLQKPLTYTLDADGYLVDINNAAPVKGVWLPTGTYRVTYTITGASITPHDIVITTDHTEENPALLRANYIPPVGTTVQTLLVASSVQTGQVLYLSGSTILGVDPASLGMSDHGSLNGLDDDDHTQYALADGTRGEFAATNHEHEINDISDATDTGKTLMGTSDLVATLLGMGVRLVSEPSLTAPDDTRLLWAVIPEEV